MAHFLFITILCSLIHSIAFPKLTFGAAEHTLFHNQTLAVGQNLVSENLVFELGFCRPGRSTNLFLGIWYRATPDIVVWVANRNNPVTVSQGVVLAISENGSLAICRDGTVVVWSAAIPSTAASRPRVRLLDTGNLVVLDETSDGYLWQSFDHPTDTWLPGMTMVDDADAGFLTSWRNAEDPSMGDFSYRIENEGLPQLVIYRGKAKIFRTGKWNGLYFNGVPRFPNLIFNPRLVFREERLVSVLVRPNDSSVMTRTKLDITGSLQRYTMNSRRDKWSSVSTFPRDQCDEYGHCGPNSICTIEKAQRCECFRGFSPKFEDDWDFQDWSGECARMAALKCESEDGFVEVRGVKYPDMLRYWLNSSMSLDECKTECLKNCSCTAYANPFIVDGGSGCLMWFGDLVDTRELSAADGVQSIYIRIPVSELDFGTNLEEEKKRPIKIILISIASGVIVSNFINGGILLLKRRNKQGILQR